MKDEKVIQIAVAATPYSTGPSRSEESRTIIVGLTDQGRVIVSQSQHGFFGKWEDVSNFDDLLNQGDEK